MRIPLFIEFSGRRVLVVGGGNVGTRRALKFLEAGAKVIVASVDFKEELVNEAKRNPRLSLLKCDAGDLEVLEPLIEWSDLVVLATPNLELNRKIAELAAKKRKLVNDATNAELTEVVVPFEFTTSYGLRVAITSEGKCGVAAHKAADKVKEILEEDVEIRTLYEVMSRFKKKLKEAVDDPRRRFPIYFKVADDPEFQRLVREGKVEEAFKRALEVAGLEG